MHVFSGPKTDRRRPRSTTRCSTLTFARLDELDEQPAALTSGWSGNPCPVPAELVQGYLSASEPRPWSGEKTGAVSEATGL